jgi:hypothetical protein
MARNVLPPKAGPGEPLRALVQRLLIWRAVASMKLDAARGHRKLRARFKAYVGYTPNFEAPATMNEKINWRKLHDRAAVYPVISDKIRVHDYLVRALGPERAAALRTPIRLVTARPTASALRAAGTGVAIKANHGCGWVRIVPDGAEPDWQALAAEARNWLRLKHGLHNHEWAYWSIPPKILVEELVLGPDNEPAPDLKFAVMDGRCTYIFREADRFSNHAISYYHPDWTPMELAMGINPVGAHVPAPFGLDEMRTIAEEIGRDFDYIRVDFLAGADRLCLNELTLYRSSGLAAFDPPELDLHFGQMWHHRPYSGFWAGGEGAG